MVFVCGLGCAFLVLIGEEGVGGVQGKGQSCTGTWNVVYFTGFDDVMGCLPRWGSLGMVNRGLCGWAQGLR